MKRIGKCCICRPDRLSHIDSSAVLCVPHDFGILCQHCRTVEIREQAVQLFRLEVQSLADNRTVINSQSFKTSGIRVGFIRCLQRFFRLRAFFKTIICIVVCIHGVRLSFGFFQCRLSVRKILQHYLFPFAVAGEPDIFFCLLIVTGFKIQFCQFDINTSVPDRVAFCNFISLDNIQPVQQFADRGRIVFDFPITASFPLQVMQDLAVLAGVALFHQAIQDPDRFCILMCFHIILLKCFQCF